MDKIVPCLWYNHNAEEAANFYITLFPDSRIDDVMRSPVDTPSGKEGDVLVVEFTLAGRRYVGLNGGSMFTLSEAFSMQVRTEDQEETDRLWDAIVSNGGEESVCGWCKDRWGLSWQITPKRLLELNTDPDAARARRAMQAMMKMRKIDIAAVKAAADGETVAAD